MQKVDSLCESPCRLAMLVDPVKQSPEIAAKRVGDFLIQGGSIVLIGGSGEIDPSIFQKSVRAITQVTKKQNSISVFIFPGHLGQIPDSCEGIQGVFNYSNILGASGQRDFDQVYPEVARRRVLEILRKRNLETISTLYILCGDPRASISRITGISPMDLNDPDQKTALFQKTENWLQEGIDCIYLESGSGSTQAISPDIVREVRRRITEFSPQTLLFVGGGINSPEKAGIFAQHADCVVVGTHFEHFGVNEVSQFVLALKN